MDDDHAESIVRRVARQEALGRLSDLDLAVLVPRYLGDPSVVEVAHLG